MYANYVLHETLLENCATPLRTKRGQALSLTICRCRHACSQVRYLPLMHISMPAPWPKCTCLCMCSFIQVEGRVDMLPADVWAAASERCPTPSHRLRPCHACPLHSRIKGVNQFDSLLSKVNILAKMLLPCRKRNSPPSIFQPQLSWVDHSIRHKILYNLIRSKFRFPVSLEHKQAMNNLNGQFCWSGTLLTQRKTKFRSDEVVQNFMADRIVHPARLWLENWGRSSHFSTWNCKIPKKLTFHSKMVKLLDVERS